MHLKQLTSALDNLLKPSLFKDYCPNGLQVQGRPEVNRVVAGVTASKDLILSAINAEADAILVHHGYFWRGESPVITGVKAERIKLLMRHEISLIGYHLPLDAHPQLGNNAQLGALLGLEVIEGMDNSLETSIGLIGHLETPETLDQFSSRVERCLNRKPLVINAGDDHTIRRIAWCTGAAQGRIQDAADLGCDLYLSGEISEQTMHLAKELNIHYVAAGHHATERYGVKAVAKWLGEQYSLSHQFIDIDNPA